MMNDGEACVIAQAQVHEHDVWHFRQCLGQSFREISGDSRQVRRARKSAFDELSRRQVLGHYQDMQRDAKILRPGCHRETTLAGPGSAEQPVGGSSLFQQRFSKLGEVDTPKTHQFVASRRARRKFNLADGDIGHPGEKE